jgi:SecD/SecF fusion protein
MGYFYICPYIIPMKFKNKIILIFLLPLISCNGLFHKKTGVAVNFELEIASRDASVFGKIRSILVNRLETSGFNSGDIEFQESDRGLQLIINDFDSTKMQLVSVRRLLTMTGRIEFWETYEYTEIIMQLVQADKVIASASALGLRRDTVNRDTSSVLFKLGFQDTTAPVLKAQREHPLFSLLQPCIDQVGKALPGPVIGRSLIKDTAQIMSYLNAEKIKNTFPEDLRFAWTLKPMQGAETVMQLLALKARKGGKAALAGDFITEARKEYSKRDADRPHITMTMNDEAAGIWEEITEDNIGRSIAMVLDDLVYSYPTVQGKIIGGISQITGDFTSEEVSDLVNIIKSGRMPVQIRIVGEKISFKNPN